MKKLVLFSVFILSLIFLPYANADTHNAASVSQADVETAIAAASSGDLVIVPSGTATWGSVVTIDKGITIQGQTTGCPLSCVSGTTINGYGFKISAANVRITGFTLDVATGFDWGGSKNFRIDHNSVTCSGTFKKKGGESLKYGLIDNNYIAGGGTEHWYAMGNGNTSWTTGGDGGQDTIEDGYVYVEDNYFYFPPCQYMDSGSGARMVIRFNTFQEDNTASGGVFLAAHGHLWAHRDGPSNAGTYHFEIYNNTFNFDGANRTWGGFLSPRGGRWYCFNNTFIENGSVYFRNYESTGSYTALCSVAAHESMGVPPGHTLPWASDCDSWPCPMQINNSYIFGNTLDGSGPIVVNQSTSHIQSGRDYFAEEDSGVTTGLFGNMPGTCNEGEGYWATDKGTWNSTGTSGVLYRCNAADTWIEFYEPENYPHPLQGTSVAMSGTATVGINESDVVAGGKRITFISIDAFVSTLGTAVSATTDFIASLSSNRSETYGWNNVVLAGLNHTHCTLVSGNTTFHIDLPAFGNYNIFQTEEKITPSPPGIAFESGVTPTGTSPTDFSIGVEIPDDPPGGGGSGSYSGTGMRFTYSPTGRRLTTP